MTNVTAEQAKAIAVTARYSEVDMPVHVHSNKTGVTKCGTIVTVNDDGFIVSIHGSAIKLQFDRNGSDNKFSNFFAVIDEDTELWRRNALEAIEARRQGR